jgi:uncharacterized membrane protein HdeD (DUF308 family)
MDVMTSRLGPSKLHTTAWVASLILGIMMLGAGLFILSQPVDANDFEAATGIVWEEYQTADPEAADYLVREAQLLGVSFAVLGGIAAALAWTMLRRGNRTAWTITWFIPIAFTATAAVFFGSDAAVLGSFYAVAAVFGIAIVWAGRRTAWQ